MLSSPDSRALFRVESTMSCTFIFVPLPRHERTPLGGDHLQRVAACELNNVLTSFEAKLEVGIAKLIDTRLVKFLGLPSPPLDLRLYLFKFTRARSALRSWRRVRGDEGIVR
jgi:hypothetical protein